MKTTSETVSVGDIVKYSRPQSEYERGCRFILLSDPNVVNAVSIQLVCDLRIKPIEIVEVGEITGAK